MSLIRAVIFDWAGTAVDFGSIAPVAAFAATLKAAGVRVSNVAIRSQMGLEKREHLLRILRDWGADPSEADLDRLYTDFSERLALLLPSHAQPVPGLLDVIAQLRAAGVKIGSNSGYSRPMMDVLAAAARERGFEPDCIVSASDVERARPAPDLSLKALELLDVAAGPEAVKVDDTAAGIEEGKNAGLWTVAVAVSGNETGLSLEEWLRLDAGRKAEVRERAYERLRRSDPDYIIDSVADLMPVLNEIEGR